MRNKKVPTVFATIGVLGILSQTMLEPLFKSLGVCEEKGLPQLCFNLFQRDFMQAIALFSVALLISSGVLFLAKPQVNRVWLRMTFFAIIIYALAVTVSPVTGGLLQPQRDITSLWLSILYVMISAILITYKSWKIKTSGEGL